MENSEKSRKIQKQSIIGAWGSEAFSILNFKKRVARKLRRISLLHLELLSFRFNFGKLRKVIIFMILRLWDASMILKANYFYLWKTRILQKVQETIPIFSKKMMVGTSRILNIGKGGGQQSWRSVLFWKPWTWSMSGLLVLSIGSISLKSMKLKFGIAYGINIYQNHGIEIW